MFDRSSLTSFPWNAGKPWHNLPRPLAGCPLELLLKEVVQTCSNMCTSFSEWCVRRQMKICTVETSRVSSSNPLLLCQCPCCTGGPTNTNFVVLVTTTTNNNNSNNSSSRRHHRHHHCHHHHCHHHHHLHQYHRHHQYHPYHHQYYYMYYKDCWRCGALSSLAVAKGYRRAQAVELCGLHFWDKHANVHHLWGTLLDPKPLIPSIS